MNKTSTTDKGDVASIFTDFSICSWMIDELHLTGSALLLFAYIFSMTVDNMHPTATSLSTLTKISGLTRQTITRSIDKLPYIIKNASQDNDKGFYAYYYYRVDSFALLSFLESLGKDIYRDYIQSFKNEIFEKFECTENIETDLVAYLNDVINISNKSFSEQFAQHQTVRELANLDTDYSSFKEAVTALTKKNMSFYDWVKAINILAETSKQISETSSEETVAHSNNTTTKESNVRNTKHKPGGKNPADLGLGGTFAKKEQLNKTKEATKSLLSPDKKVDKTAVKMEKRNQSMQPYKDIALNYVLTECDNNQELLEQLYNYIETCIFRSVTGSSAIINMVQFKEQLKELSKFTYVEDRIDTVHKAFMNGYRSICYAKQWEIDKVNIRREGEKSVPKLIDDFMVHYNNDEQIKDIVTKYWSTVSISRGLTSEQFKTMLELAAKANLPKNILYDIVNDAYAHGYTKWSLDKAVSVMDNDKPVARKHAFVIGVPNDEDDQTVVTTLEEREKAVDEMCLKYCLLLNPELKDSLMKYVKESSVGQKMSYKQVCSAITLLVQRRNSEADMVKCVQNAIEHNYPELCLPDSNLDNIIKKSYRNVDEFVDFMVRQRRTRCKEYMRLHPEDPRIKDMERLFQPTT